MLVSELEGFARQNPDHYINVDGSNMEMVGRHLQLPDRVLNFNSDPDGLAALAKFFKAPGAFVKRLPDDIVEDIFNWCFAALEDRKIILAVDSDEALHRVYRGDIGLLGRGDFVGVVEKTFAPDDEVVGASFSQGEVHLDVVTNRITTEPRVGDVTRAGVRITGHLSPVEKQPKVQSYLRRLKCSNGMCVDEAIGQIRIKGTTLAEVVREMEEAAHLIFDKLDHRLDQWASLANQPAVNPELLIHRLASEARLNPAVESRIIGRAPELEGDSVYDVVNLITGAWNMEGISARAMTSLQELGGRVVATSGQHRCHSCAASLDFTPRPT